MTEQSQVAMPVRGPGSVSIVVLNWNGLDHLGPCLESLRSLQYPRDRWEVIVVDNGSTDGSVDFIRTNFPEVRLLLNPVNTGYAPANNQGARASEAEYVAFLNNDTHVHPLWLSELVSHMEANPQTALAGSLVLDWTGRKVDFADSAMTAMGRGFQLGFKRPVKDAPQQPSARLFVNGAGMLTRRSLFLDAGGFDDRYFAYYEDVDLGWRFWVLGWEVMLVPSSIVFHRHHGSSKRQPGEKREVLYVRNALMTVIKNYDDATLRDLLPIGLLAHYKELKMALGVKDATLRLSPADRVFNIAAALPPDRDYGSLIETFKAIARGAISARVWLARAVVKVIVPRALVVPPGVAANIVGMGQVLDVWPELLADRERIQAQRKRPDSEIFPLFNNDAGELQGHYRVYSNEYTIGFYRALEAVGLERLAPLQQLPQ